MEATSELDKKWAYTLHHSQPAPQKGQYLVMLGKRGISKVCLIKAVRPIRHRQSTHKQTYMLSVRIEPELKDFTVFELTSTSAKVWVRGVPALPFFWIPRNKRRNNYTEVS